MADEFDHLLASALAPGERQPDRTFVLRVQAAIRLDEQLRSDRRSLASALAKQLAAIMAIGAALWCLGRAPAIAVWSAESTAIALALLLAAFAALTCLIIGGTVRHRRTSGLNHMISAS